MLSVIVLLDLYSFCVSQVIKASVNNSMKGSEEISPPFAYYLSAFLYFNFACFLRIWLVMLFSRNYSSARRRIKDTLFAACMLM